MAMAYDLSVRLLSHLKYSADGGMLRPFSGAIFKLSRAGGIPSVVEACYDARDRTRGGGGGCLLSLLLSFSGTMVIVHHLQHFQPVLSTCAEVSTTAKEV
eukprot:COSAG05_NODE_12477_length_466_cov_1.125341_1_plen_100_part_00